MAPRRRKPASVPRPSRPSSLTSPEPPRAVGSAREWRRNGCGSSAEAARGGARPGRKLRRAAAPRGPSRARWRRSHSCAPPMDERHAQLAAMRTDVHKVGELTHLVDLDFDARLLRLASLRLLTGVGRLFRERLGFEAAEILDDCPRETSGTRRICRKALAPSQRRTARRARRARVCRRLAVRTEGSRGRRSSRLASESRMDWFQWRLT